MLGFRWAPLERPSLLRHWTFAAALAAALLIAGGEFRSAGATFAGANGKVAYSGRYIDRYEIFLINPDGSGGMRLTDLGVDSFQPAWSPDGSHIAFHGRVPGQPQSSSMRRMFYMRADGSGLTPIPAPSNAKEPAWSPDGRRVVFAASDDPATAPRPARIWASSLNGSGSVPVSRTYPMAAYPEWSPDGRRIVFVGDNSPSGSLSDNQVSDAHIRVVNADGSAERTLTTAGGVEDSTPSWSPDGSRIAFTRYDGGSREIYSMAADGANVTRLTNLGSASNPAWSPDGRSIVFVSDGIYVMNADGSAQRRMTANPANGGPDWQPIPDRDRDGVGDPSDCDDGNAGRYPGAREIVDDGIDQDCDGADAIDYDRDRDGFERRGRLAARDCDDNRRDIHPGARDVPGDRIDQDCSGKDAAFSRVTTTFSFSWLPDQRCKDCVRLTRLTALNVSRGTSLRLTCRGARNCRMNKTLRAARRDRDRVNLMRYLGRRRLRVKTVIEVTATAPRSIGSVKRLVVVRSKRGGAVTVSDRNLCLSPGAKRPARRCLTIR